MLKIAIIEKEQFAKDAIFALQKIVKDEFSFVYYEKISEFIKLNKTDSFDVIILNEAYNNIRVSDALNYQKSNTVIIYCSEEEVHNEHAMYSRIFTIYKKEYQKDLLRLQTLLEERLNKHKEYLFSYNGVSIKLKYHDIYYIEKEDKYLVYHTKKGNFYERGTITTKSEELANFDFIRIHSGIIVNYEYIFKIDSEDIELQDHTILPISRARKSSVLKFIRDKNKAQ